MDNTSRIFYGFILLAIIGTVISQNNDGNGNLNVAMPALVVLGIVLALVLFNVFERYALRDNLREERRVFAGYRKVTGVHLNALEAQLQNEQQAHAKTTTQKKRFITLWRKAMGYI